jgi:ParE-like toxin of type II bacterial toxin-antitoxin system
MTIDRQYKSPFRRFVKKAKKPLQLAVEDEVDSICENPSIGELKIGDLAGIFVHKFKFNRVEYLLAYRLLAASKDENPSALEFLTIVFYKLGTHENFYDELKRYLMEE